MKFIPDEEIYVVKENLTWENVLSSSHCKPGIHIGKFIKEVVIPSGYEYFSWNGAIMKVLYEGNYIKTNIYVKDVK